MKSRGRRRAGDRAAASVLVRNHGNEIDMSFAKFGAGVHTLSSGDDAVRLEGVIAFARALVAATALVGLDVNAAARYPAVAYSTVGAYVVASLIVLIAGRTFGRMPRGLPLVLHACDVCIAVSLTVFTTGPNSPFFVLFVYIVMAAACRWGFGATVVTMVVTAMMVGSEAALLGDPPDLPGGLTGNPLGMNFLVTRIEYLGIVGILLGYLGHKELVRRREASIVAAATRRAQTATGVHGVFESMIGTLVKLFSARQAFVVLQHSLGDQPTMWTVERRPDSGHPIVAAHPLEAAAHARYLRGHGHTDWHIRRRRRGCSFTLVDPDSRCASTDRLPVARAVLDAQSCRAVMSVPLLVRGKLAGRVFLLDPQVGFDPYGALRLAHRIAAEFGERLQAVYRLRRLRSQVEHEERTRIALELHDGVLQSLSGVEMRLDVVRRHIEAVAPSDAQEIVRIEAWCRAEAKNIRLLTRRMARMQLPADSKPVEEDLTALVQRFERESGISARFVSDSRQRVPARLHAEVTRIVQEGLVNVRKHSGAHHVFVHAVTSAGRLKVSIADDGRGFPFAGRRSLRELEAMRQGPAVIQRRVKALSGRLIVESMPGKGARLDVDVPLQAS